MITDKRQQKGRGTDLTAPLSLYCGVKEIG